MLHPARRARRGRRSASSIRLGRKPARVLPPPVGATSRASRPARACRDHLQLVPPRAPAARGEPVREQRGQRRRGAADRRPRCAYSMFPFRFTSSRRYLGACPSSPLRPRAYRGRTLAGPARPRLACTAGRGGRVRRRRRAQIGRGAAEGSSPPAPSWSPTPADGATAGRRAAGPVGRAAGRAGAVRLRAARPLLRPLAQRPGPGRSGASEPRAPRPRPRPCASPPTAC